MAMKIVADENIVALEQFACHGEVVALPGREIQPVHLKDADALLVRTITEVNAALLADSPVKFVGSFTIGTDHLDSAWLEQAGIDWAHAPGCNADAVVDYVLTALLSLDIVLPDICVGVVGCGNVGSRLIARLQAFGVKTLGCDPLLEAYKKNSIEEVVKQCDVICLHTPLTLEGEHATCHLLNKSRLQSLKPNAVLINAGRGAVIDNQALLDIMQQREDIRVVLDVWEGEPQLNTTLLDSVVSEIKHIGTPHIAGYSRRGKVTATTMVYEKFCQSFGLSPVSASTSDDDVTVLDWNDVCTIRALALQVYPLLNDHDLLRTLIHAAQAEQAGVFDKLRKDYVPRREFRDCRVIHVPEMLRDQVGALGFQLG